MKYLSNILFAIAMIFAVVFGFILFWQKQQNEHTERMVGSAVNQVLQKQSSVIEIAQVEEEKSLKERMKEGVKTAIAFVLSIFTKF